MRRLFYVSTVVAFALLSLVAAGVLAQTDPPAADATPGAVNVTGVVLGAVDSAAVPGYRLVMAETVFAPGGYVTQHTHPTTIVVCIQSGALGFAIQHGAATVTRSETRTTPEAAEQLALNAEIVLNPGDCVAFDHFAQHTVHTAWNESEEPTVLWEARLLKIDEPFTTFVDAQGTPVP
jgi:predicted metal-dependent enzyme (double-stranded beta helix superfamily)